MKDFLTILIIAIVIGTAFIAIKIAGIVGGFLMGIFLAAWFLWNAIKEHRNARP